MFDFTQHLSTRLRRLVTPQAEPIPGTTQVPNAAGGYARDVGHWGRHDRFIVLGTSEPRRRPPLAPLGIRTGSDAELLLGKSSEAQRSRRKALKLSVVAFMHLRDLRGSSSFKLRSGECSAPPRFDALADRQSRA